ncbi:MAG: branched-chain amino acid ABC transporter permease [Chloroflexota bacterium]|nr:MAG: branched-chain amino acid ABC transporter permease [Chloroflexota bacterium]
MPLIVLALAIVVPYFFAGDRYILHNLIVISLYGVLTLSLGLVMGYSGQFCLAQAAFLGIGAYTSTLLMQNLNLHFGLASAAGAVAAAVAALMIGYPSLRLKGIYFAMATFAFGELVVLVLKNWTDVTKGVYGISITRRPDPIPIPFGGQISFESNLAFYYLTLAALVITFIVIRQLVNSRFGRALLAIREDEELAQSIGVALTKYKMIAFAIGALLAGMMGGFYATYLTFIIPDSFGIDESLKMVMIVLIGGSGTLAGPIVGSAVLVALPEMLEIPPTARMIAYGIVLILCIRFLPQGIVGTLSMLGNRRTRLDGSQGTKGEWPTTVLDKDGRDGQS